MWLAGRGDESDDMDFEVKHPIDYYGRLVLRACSTLPGKNYILCADKLFMSPQLALNLLEYNVATVGPVQLRKVSKMMGPGILMSSAKKARPTVANPRGKVTMGHTPAGDAHVFGFMDSSLVHFITTHQGYTVNIPVYRNLPAGRTSYNAPADINYYNKNMNVIDAQDQLRTGACNIERSRTNKWTDIFIMGLYSWTLTQAYLIYRHFNKEDLGKRSHSSFQLQVAQAFIFNPENRAMHQQLARRPVQPSRHSSSTPAIPTGHCHSMDYYAKGRGTDNRRKRRYACVVCPVDPTGSTNKTTTFCFECRVPVHLTCFATLHNEQKFTQVRTEGHKETIAHLEGN